jgi:hypothetical protein
VAERAGVVLDGVRVVAGGSFDDAWRLLGLEYAVELRTSATPEQQDPLLAAVDAVAEIPRALRAGLPVTRVPSST